MNPNIIHREIIVLPEKQLQMLRSGWGSASIDDTIVEAIVYMSDGYEVQGYIAYPGTISETAENAKDAKGKNETAQGELTAENAKNAEGKNETVGHVDSSQFENLNPSSLRSSRPLRFDELNPSPSATSAVNNLPPLPCIIWNRGGSKERGAIDKFTARGMFGQLASWGFVVFASMYRASFNDELHDEFGGSDVDDILNLMEIANEISFADTSRWAMEGWSRGGMMTYLALQKRHDVKAAIISGGITDVAECCLNVPRIQATLQQLMEIEGIGIYEKRSAIHFADELPKDCKYLIIHGTKDETVSPLQAIKIAEKLLEQKLYFRLVLLEEADHFLKGKKKIVDELRREWLSKYV